MSSAQLGAISNSKKGENWAFVDDSGSYLDQSILKIPSGGYYLYMSYTFLLTKITDTGKVVWQKTLPVSANIALSDILSDGSILMSGYLDQFPDLGVVARLTPETGIFSWYTQFNMGAQIEMFSVTAAKEPSETHCYALFTRQVSGPDPNTDPYYATISRFDLSTGLPVWSREIVAPNGLRSFASTVKTDSSGNAYVNGHYQHDLANNLWRGFLVKFNTSGTTQWQKMLSRNNTGPATDFFFSENLSIDSSNNLHFSGTCRYGTDPIYGMALYYSKLNSSGTVLNHYLVLPDPVPAIEFPTQINSATASVVDSSGSCYLALYGQFDRSISTQISSTVLRISNGNTLDFLNTAYIGNSVTEGFSGPGAMSVDSSLNKMLFSVYRFTGGPEAITFYAPSDGSAAGIKVAPKALKANYENIMPAALSTPPVTVGSGVMTIRSATESFSITTPTISTAQVTTYQKYIQRF